MVPHWEASGSENFMAKVFYNQSVGTMNATLTIYKRFEEQTKVIRFGKKSFDKSRVYPTILVPISIYPVYRVYPISNFLIHT